jgi:rSAM/selenodomain-associated transferase 1
VAQAAICVFAKPPLAGIAKTRLVPSIGPERAARLADAFLQDTLMVLRTLPWAHTVVAATELFAKDYIPDNCMWIQPEGPLNIRLENILQRALMQYPMAFALGADSPGLPAGHLDQAKALLALHDAVLGLSRDGGFYLLGVKNAPGGLLNGIQWSQPTTFQNTVSRLREQGLSVGFIPEWFDVDTEADLSYLQHLLSNGTIACPCTQAVMQEIKQSSANAP